MIDHEHTYRNDSDVRFAEFKRYSETGLIPANWTRLPLNPGDLAFKRTVFKRASVECENEWYLNVYQPIRRIRNNTVSESQRLTEAAQYEYDALKEHLCLMDRSEDTRRIEFYSSNGVNAVIVGTVSKL